MTDNAVLAATGVAFICGAWFGLLLASLLNASAAATAASDNYVVHGIADESAPDTGARPCAQPEPLPLSGAALGVAEAQHVRPVPGSAGPVVLPGDSAT